MVRAMRPTALIAYLTVGNGAEALSFYQKAFGARVIAQQTAEDGEKIIHAHLKIGSLGFMLSDYFEDMNATKSAPQKQGKRSIVLQWVFESQFDLDGFLEKVLAEGCQITCPFENMFWGEYYGEITDPFGFIWGLIAPGDEGDGLVRLM